MEVISTYSQQLDGKNEVAGDLGEIEKILRGIEELICSCFTFKKSDAVHCSQRKSFYIQANICIQGDLLDLLIILKYCIKNAQEPSVLFHLEIKIPINLHHTQSSQAILSAIKTLKQIFKSQCQILSHHQGEITFRFNQTSIPEGKTIFLIKKLESELCDFQQDLKNLYEKQNNQARLIFKGQRDDKQTNLFRQLKVSLNLKSIQKKKRAENFDGLRIATGYLDANNVERDQKYVINRQQMQKSFQRVKKQIQKIDGKLEAEDKREIDRYNKQRGEIEIQNSRSVYRLLSAIKIKLKSETRLIQKSSFSEVVKGVFLISRIANTIAPLRNRFRQTDFQSQITYLKDQCVILAAKKILNQIQPSKSALSSKRNEMNFMRMMANVSHSHFPMYFADESGVQQFEQRTLFSEFSNEGNALKFYEDILRLKRFISPFNLLGILETMLKPLIFLQKYSLIHRDVKLSNYLWLKNSLKLIDFGSVYFSRAYTGQERPQLESSLKTTYSLCQKNLNTFIKYKQNQQRRYETTSIWEGLSSDMPFHDQQAKQFLDSFVREDISAYHEHENFDISSFGFILLRTIEIVKIIFHGDSWMEINLKFLANNCLKLNPKERPTLKQAFTYLHEMKIQEMAFFRDKIMC